MRKRNVSALCCLLAVCLFGTSPVFALDPQPTVEELIDLRLEESGTEDIQDYIDTVLAPQAGAGGESAFLALTQRGEQYDCKAYAAATLRYLSANSVPSAATRLKYALTLMAAGCESDYISQVMSDSVGELGIMSWVYALHLMNNGAQSPDHTPEQVVETLLNLRLDDGGWAVYGSASDVDVTAMVLQSLAPYYGEDDRVTAAADGAMELLSARQQPDGGYTSFGQVNAESAAQVIIALCALDIDPAADPRFAKEGGSVVDSLLSCRLADGGFAHTRGGPRSASADEQALCALVAMERREAGLGSLFILDPRENGTPADAVYIPYSPSETQTEPSRSTGGSAKLWICAAVAVLAAGACAVLWFMGKRSVKNFAVIAAATLVIMGGVMLLDVRTPDQYYGGAIEKPDAVGEVSYSISCEVIAEEKEASHVPADGIILSERALPLCKGETVYDLLIQAAQAEGFTIESGSTSYIQGIAGIREHDFGQLSGWVYRVNGEVLSVGCDSCVLQPGDRVEWLYSLELGREFEN